MAGLRRREVVEWRGWGWGTVRCGRPPASLLTPSGGERRLMLTSWDALLDLMERVVRGAGDGEAETDIHQLRGMIDL